MLQICYYIALQQLRVMNWLTACKAVSQLENARKHLNQQYYVAKYVRQVHNEIS